jgi:spore maturation protein CgeB
MDLKPFKVDVLLPLSSQYHVLHRFTEEIYRAFVRQGFQARLIAEQDHFRIPCEDPPDMTFGVNGIPQNAEGFFLCDLTQVPHLTFLVDPPYHFMNLMNQPLIHIACHDRFCSKMLPFLKYENEPIFMPHAIEADFTKEFQKEKLYDVVFLGSFQDHFSRLEWWRKNYPEPLVEVMLAAVEIVFSDDRTSTTEAFQCVFNQYLADGRLEGVEINFTEILVELEMYVKGKSRFDLISAFKETHVHVFGAGDWKRYFGDRKNVTIHAPVEYEEALQVIKSSKIVLNSFPWIKEGLHERILAGAVCGALVATNENIFLKETFKDKENILFFVPNRAFEQLEEAIRYYLENENERKKLVVAAREVVKDHHTWDQRLSKLSLNKLK